DPERGEDVAVRRVPWAHERDPVAGVKRREETELERAGRSRRDRHLFRIDRDAVPAAIVPRDGCTKFYRAKRARIAGGLNLVGRWPRAGLTRTEGYDVTAGSACLSNVTGNPHHFERRDV